MVHMHATWYTLTDRSKPTAMLPPVEANNQATTFQAITYRIRHNCMEGTSVCCNPPNMLCCACSWCAYHSQLAMAQISTAFDFEMTAGAADTPTLRGGGGGASRPGEMTLPVRRRTTMLNMGSESRRTTAPGFLGSSSGGGVFGEAGDIGSLSGADLLPAAAATMPLPRRMSFLGPPGEPPAALDRWGWGTRVTPGEGSHPLLYFIDSVAAAHHNLMCDGCGGAPAGVPCCQQHANRDTAAAVHVAGGTPSHVLAAGGPATAPCSISPPPRERWALGAAQRGPCMATSAPWRTWQMLWQQPTTTAAGNPRVAEG
jgi:hypothetical protein